MMKTLYDLLGALPKDSAEDLRTAFRRAVKGAHPDLHPGDPDAALKFREIVRASEILGDAEQREAYDHLLDLAHLEQVSASEQATAAKCHRFASGMIALAGVSVMTAGSYLLFMHMSAASLAPAEKPTVPASASVGPSPATTGNGAALVKNERAGIHGRAIEPSATVDQASRPDPKLSPAPTDRGAIFYRLRKFDRAFADIAPVRRIETTGRTRSASTTSDTPRSGPAAIAHPVTPLPRRRPVVQDPSREESVASVRLRSRSGQYLARLPE